MHARKHLPKQHTFAKSIFQKIRVMQSETHVNPPLNDVQLMLLKLFSRPMSNQDLFSIRDMLLAYYDAMLQKELDNVIEAKKIERSDFDRILNEHQRTK